LPITSMGGGLAGVLAAGRTRADRATLV
jgi:hypothetical protein